MFHVRAVKPFGGEILILVCLLLSYRDIPWHWSNVLLHWCSSTVMSALLPIFLTRDRSVEHESLFDDDVLFFPASAAKLEHLSSRLLNVSLMSKLCYSMINLNDIGN